MKVAASATGSRRGREGVGLEFWNRSLAVSGASAPVGQYREYVRGIERAIVFTAAISSQLFQRVSTFVFCTMQRSYAFFVLFPLFTTYGFRLRRTLGIVLPDAEVGCVTRCRGHCTTLLVIWSASKLPMCASDSLCAVVTLLLA